MIQAIDNNDLTTIQALQYGSVVYNNPHTGVLIEWTILTTGPYML